MSLHKPSIVNEFLCLWNIFNIVKWERPLLCHLNFLTMWTIISILEPLETSRLPIGASLSMDSLTFVCLKWKVSLMIPADIYSVPFTQWSQRAPQADLRAVHGVEVNCNDPSDEDGDGSPRLWHLICRVVSGAFPISWASRWWEAWGQERALSISCCISQWRWLWLGPGEVLILCLPHTNFRNQQRADLMKCCSGTSLYPSSYPDLLSCSIFNHLKLSWDFLLRGEKGGDRSQDKVCWFRRFTVT